MNYHDLWEGGYRIMLFISQGSYLRLVAKTVYFLPIEERFSVKVMSYQKRLLLK
jgi:hypothetical protein